jgi:hypothetical protein
MFTDLINLLREDGRFKIDWNEVSSWNFPSHSRPFHSNLVFIYLESFLFRAVRFLRDAQGHLRDAVDEHHSNGRSEVHRPIARTSLHRARKPVMRRCITVCAISVKAREYDLSWLADLQEPVGQRHHWSSRVVPWVNQTAETFFANSRQWP